jgi:hypothetical protein
MLTPEEIRSANLEKANAIFDRFEPVEPKQELNKSEDAQSEMYWTASDLSKFKEDLFKGIDEGTVSEDDLEKAQEELLSLSREAIEIEGDLVEVFVKKG